MSSVVFVITNDPKERCDLVSAVLAQALTALSFEHECEIFLMDKGVNLVKKGYIEGLKSTAFESLSVMLENYREMEGKIYFCEPALVSCGLQKEDCTDNVSGFVNASKLIESGIKASAVFTF